MVPSVSTLRSKRVQNMLELSAAQACCERAHQTVEAGSMDSQPSFNAVTLTRICASILLDIDFDFREKV